MNEDSKPVSAHQVQEDGVLHGIVIKFEDGHRKIYYHNSEALAVIKEHDLKLYDSWSCTREVELPK